MRLKPFIKRLAGESAPVVGLDVGQSSVKAVKFERRGGMLSKPEVFKLSREEEGFVDDEELFSHLAEWLSSIGAKGADVVVGIPQHVTTVQITSFPKESSKALDGMVAFQTSQLADLSDDAFVHDYHVMGDGEGEQLPVIIGVCLETIVQDRAEKFVAAGVKVVDFGISSLAMASAFVDLRPELSEDGKVYLLLDIGTESTTMVVVSNGRIDFCGTLDFAGESYVAAMAEQWGKGASEVRSSARRPHIRTRGEESELGRVAQSLVAEIEAGIEYWHEQSDDEGSEVSHVDGIMLCGGGGTLPGLLDFLERSMECEVALLNAPGVKKDGNGAEFAVAYGLALQAAGRSHIALSLAPAYLKWHAKREKRGTILMVAAVSLAIALPAGFALQWRNLDTKDKAYDKQLAHLEKCEDIIEDLGRTGEELKTLETVQLPVLEYGNRAWRYSNALELIAALKADSDWFVYFGDRGAFDMGKPKTDREIAEREREKRGEVINPFAAPVFRMEGKVDPEGPMYPVAEETEPLDGLVAAGFSKLVKGEPYQSISELIQKLGSHPFFGDVDLLVASEALGREDIFAEWYEYIEEQRTRGRLPHGLTRFMLRLTFSQPDVKHAPETPGE